MPAGRNLARLHDAGVSIWLDTLSRPLLEGGEFKDLVRDCSVTGATLNAAPSSSAKFGITVAPDQPTLPRLVVDRHTVKTRAWLPEKSAPACSIARLGFGNGA